MSSTTDFIAELVRAANEVEKMGTHERRKIGKATSIAVATPPCDNCESTGWVCEEHPRRPWMGRRECGCGAAGVPCPVCNWSRDPDYKPDTSVIEGSDENS